MRIYMCAARAASSCRTMPTKTRAAVICNSRWPQVLLPKRIPRNLSFTIDDADRTTLCPLLFDKVVGAINALALHLRLGNYSPARHRHHAPDQIIDGLSRLHAADGFLPHQLFKRLESLAPLPALHRASHPANFIVCTPSRTPRCPLALRERNCSTPLFRRRPDESWQRGG